jgi:RNA polymerase sigma factor (sigma-70 family)
MGRRPMPFRIWLFRTAMQRLSKLRQHAQAARRDVSRERCLILTQSAEACEPIMETDQSPSQQVSRRERSNRLTSLLSRLPAPDRRILELRALAGLSYEEVGLRLGIEPATARKRYGRALLRIRALLLADGFTESRL